MTTVLFANNAGTTIASAVAPGDVSVTLTSGGGALFPSPTGGQIFPLTLQSASNSATFEITYCTARSGDVLTISRAKEGTSALAWNAGDLAQCRATAATLEMLQITAVGGVLTGNLPNPGMATGAAVTNIGFTPAHVAGSSGQVFSVADATTAAEAVNLSQFASDLVPDGWKQYPDPNSPTGYFIEQWGVVLISSISQNVIFPTTFPNNCLRVICCEGN